MRLALAIYDHQTILERLAEKQNDEYISKIDHKVLTKYEKNFYSLSYIYTIFYQHSRIDILNYNISENSWGEN